MPSPVPVTRLFPSLDLGTCSSPLSKPGSGSGSGSWLQVPVPRLHDRVARRSWSSVILWKELRALQPVGAGGFGSVYRARYLGQTVALKRVKKSAKNQLASRQSFWAELHAAHLRHQNIVRVIAATTCAPPEDEGGGGGLGTILMEFVGDRNLEQLIYGGPNLNPGLNPNLNPEPLDQLIYDGPDLDPDQNPVLDLEPLEPLDPGRWLRYSADIVSGLRFLHAHGIVHLDIKPANVLVSDQDVCKIVDFGCSMKLDPGSELVSNQVPVGGTYTHRAPELLKGEAVTPQADVFSFAITLWQLATRDRPYSGDRQHVLYAVVARDLRPSVRERDHALFGSDLGRKLRSLLERCWSGDVQARPRAQDLLPELEALQSQNQNQDKNPG